MDTQKTLQAIHQAGLERLAPDLGRMMEGSIRLTSRPLGSAVSPAGASRLGGQPDLPAGTAWPSLNGKPMSFIAQIRLEDAKPYDADNLLPETGMLSFFYNAAQDSYGASPDDRGGWKVLYLTEPTPLLKQTPFPAGLPDNARFKACSLSFSAETTLPFAARQIIPDLKWSDEDVKQYEDFRSSYPDPKDYQLAHDRMLGHPEQIQDDMQLQSALMANGVSSVDDPRADELSKTKSDWLLLLQVDSDSNAGMQWASSGMLYYWIERQALKQKNFNNVWLVLQSE